MLPECPDDLKFILPYLQRSAEIKGRDPIVAYYCGFYAANLAIQKGYPKTPTNEAFLMALLDELGAEKEALKDEPAIKENAAGKTHMIQFALKIFLAADNEDRAGLATRKTVQLFRVSSHFMEALRVFGEVGEEIEERIRYAKWKAADIHRAIGEGRQPMAGPPGTDQQQQNTATNTTNVSPPPQQKSPSQAAPVHQQPSPPAEQPHYHQSPPAHDQSFDGRRKSSGASERNLPSMTGSYDPNIGASFPPPPPTQPPVVSPPPPAAPRYSPPVAPKPAAPTIYTSPTVSSPPPMSYSQSPQGIFDAAEKHCRYATSAIQFEDVPTAIKEMELAIAMLRSLQPQ